MQFYEEILITPTCHLAHRHRTHRIHERYKTTVFGLLSCQDFITNLIKDTFVCPTFVFVLKLNNDTTEIPFVKFTVLREGFKKNSLPHGFSDFT
jgi:hypothetical protein